MHLINLIVKYLYRKYGVPLHNFFENWTRGTSHLNENGISVPFGVRPEAHLISRDDDLLLWCHDISDDLVAALRCASSFNLL